MDIDGETVFVTGATGFIGVRLVEKLTLEHHCKVRALVRDFRTTSWLSRTNAEIIYGDLGEPDTYDQSLSGCSIAFHCAANASQEFQEAQRINVLGTENFMAAASRAGIQRFVHLSTVAVHQSSENSLWISEETPFVGEEGDVYARTKREGEIIVRKLALSTGMKTVILRPTIVYGPRSINWTIGYFNRLKNDQIALSKSFKGTNNFVYIDDVINALLLSAKMPVSNGEAFIIGGLDNLRWIEYLEMYANLLNRPLLFWPLVMLDFTSKIFGFLDRKISEFQIDNNARKYIFRFLLRGIRRIMKPFRKINRYEIGLYNQEFRYQIEKANRLLGYKPSYTLDNAFQEIGIWLKAQNYL